MNDLSQVTLSRRELLIAGAVSATAGAVPAIAVAQTGNVAAAAAAAPLSANVWLNVHGDVG